jgi:eukaryotic-like serine/threonine-protein kinase
VVAIKIAAARYSERFQQEARAISALKHPHVCTLYDVGPNYLVMEFIEGSTLAAEIRKGPVQLGMMMRYASQIAAALAEAHMRPALSRCWRRTRANTVPPQARLGADHRALPRLQA